MTDENIEIKGFGGDSQRASDSSIKSDFVIKTSDEFNRCIDHIYDLLNSSYVLYDKGLFPSSNFFSIAAIEEIVKVYNSLFSKNVDGHAAKGTGKKIFGPDYYLWMDDRLTDAVEEEDLKGIFDLYNSGGMTNLKLDSVYTNRRSDRMTIPVDLVDKKYARNMLLFAIQAYEDNIAGYSLYAINISKKTDKLFEEVVGQV